MSIYILDPQLKLLLQRHTRQQLEDTVLETFVKLYKVNPEPVITNNEMAFVSLRKDGVVLMAPLFSDDTVTTLVFLDRLSTLLVNYLGGTVDAEGIQDNIILLHQLLDEVYDNGIPQLTDYSIIKDYIQGSNPTIARTPMNAISWRPRGIFYNKNEFFINFVERISFKYNFSVNKILTNNIHGEINCKCYLSGMPDLKLGINNSLLLTNSIINNIQYHQCVDLDSIVDKSLNFIPPDGEFDLLTYDIFNTSVLQPMILIKPLYRVFSKHNKLKLRIKVDLVTTFKRKFNMTNVNIRIPLITNRYFIDFNHQMKFKTKMGVVIHNLDDNSIIWKIEKIQGLTSAEMLAEFELITESQINENNLENLQHNKQDKNDLFYFHIGSEFKKIRKEVRIDKVVKIEFLLHNMLYSGFKVDFLTIKEEQLKAQTFPWIMYSVECKGDDYTFVLGENQFVNEIEEIEEPVREVKVEEKGDDDEEETEVTTETVGKKYIKAHMGEIKIKPQDLDFEEYME